MSTQNTHNYEHTYSNAYTQTTWNLLDNSLGDRRVQTLVLGMNTQIILVALPPQPTIPHAQDAGVNKEIA